MAEDKRLRVMIVDDHIHVRQGIRSILEDHADIQVVGEASNGVEAVTSMETLRPSLVLMDINMPRMNGIEATAEIKSLYPGTIIIGLSVNTTTGNQELMKRAGAVRLIPKEEAHELLYSAIHEAVNSP